MLKLPDIIKLSDYNGNWDKYLEIIYKVFTKDFIINSPRFNRQKLRLKRHPILNNKEATFWHLITEGPTESKRTPDMRRCERIGWPRPIIENPVDKKIRYWENERKNETRICLCYGDWEYLVVLSKRKNYILLWTAYLITKKHTREKIIKEYNRFRQTKTAS